MNTSVKFPVPTKTHDFKFPLTTSIQEKWFGAMVKLTFVANNGEEAETDWLWNTQYRTRANDKSIAVVLEALEKRINLRLRQDINMETHRKRNSEAKIHALFNRY